MKPRPRPLPNHVDTTPPTGYRIHQQRGQVLLGTISCKDCPTRLCDCAHDAWNFCKRSAEHLPGRIYVETFEGHVIFESRRTAEYLGQLRLEKEARAWRNRRAAA